jgi:CheY-like chemotaxis protein
MAASVSKGAHLEFQLTEPMPAIEADVTELRQVLMALLANASEALEEGGGKITIRTGTVERGPQGNATSSTDMGGETTEYVYVEVADTGAGMDKAIRDRMFDPFFSTKFTGRGLGLAATLGIVQGHKGEIEVDSEPGLGTEIRLLFPVITKPDKPTSEAPTGDRDRLIGKTVLIVDDEPSVLEIGKLMLERAGMLVLTANDGREAVKVFEEWPQDIDCVLLDLMMPLIGGEETLKRLRRIRESVPIVLVSGYSKDELEADYSGCGFNGFLQKPFNQETLLAILGDALARQP